MRAGAGDLCYYHRGQQYSVTALTDSSGNVTERYAYTAYGTPTITDGAGTTLTTSADDNRYTYTGREWDETLSLYHYRARMYDSLGGRFFGRDPIGFRGSRWSLYEYVNGNAVNSLDPHGLQTQAGPGTSGGPAGGGKKGWPFPKCEKNCHGFCFQVKGFGKLKNCNIKNMTAGPNCSARITVAISAFVAADGLPFVNGPCETLEDWLTNAPNVMKLPFSSCRGKNGVKCNCTNRKPFNGTPYTLSINNKVPLEQFIPSPIPQRLINESPLDLTDPNVLAEIRQCSVIVDASITLTNANGWIGQCTQRKKKVGNGGNGK